MQLRICLIERVVIDLARILAANLPATNRDIEELMKQAYNQQETFSKNSAT